MASRRVFVGNLPQDIRERELEDLFYKYGRITEIDLKLPPRPPGFAFIEFDEPRDAMAAVQGRDGYDFYGSRLRVLPYKSLLLREGFMPPQIKVSKMLGRFRPQSLTCCYLRLCCRLSLPRVVAAAEALAVVALTRVAPLPVVLAELTVAMARLPLQMPSFVFWCMDCPTLLPGRT